LKRKKFLQVSASATTALLLQSLQTIAANNKPLFTISNTFELLVLATNWGFTGTTDEFFAKAKKEGYDGAELWLPVTDAERQALFATAKKYDMKLGLLIGGNEKDAQKHFAQFKEAGSHIAALQPLYVNCHSGKDYFSFEENKLFIDYTTQLSKQTGIAIYHETHRSRMLYAATAAKTYMQKINELRLTADLSHWCVVHESLLQDQEETVELALSRTDHIHARIGHAEGPQVNDPRAPEWEAAVKQHFSWWDKVVQRKKKNGERLTILTEFGPPDYMWSLPYTRQPLADQWAINVHMMKMLRERYK
jgi:sugar phosphate isomerase/epimerase